jgi:Tol biopolymer transport system component
MTVATAVTLLQPPAPQAPAPPGTDIYLLTPTGGLASMKSSRPTPIANDPGYENQPMFSADGNRILFAANHPFDSRDGALAQGRGTQTDVYVFDRATGRTSQLTDTPENENSPTFLPAGVGEAGGFSVVRTEPDRSQRLWRFDAQGRNPQVVLTEIKPVGYHAWVDADTVALYILGGQGEPATLRIASLKTGAAAIVASNIGRSLHTVPSGVPSGSDPGVRPRLVSFVQRDYSGEWWIKEIDVSTKVITPLVRAVDGSTDRDMAWMPDGRTLLMSAGTKVFSWTRGAAAWTEVFDGAAHNLGAVSRIAVSPRGDAIAIVVAEPKR